MEILAVNFEWDEAKRKNNLFKHGLDFADAHLAFDLPIFIDLNDRESYDEVRFQAISLLHV